MSRKLYIETYGCQMNVADSEVVASILKDEGFLTVHTPDNADLILINTCSIRDNAEQKIWSRLKSLKQYKKKNRELVIGLIGCMAERLKEQILEKEALVDLIAGPDVYRSLPALVAEAGSGHKAVNVLLSREETYADIAPVRMDPNGVSSFVSIMRGCNNMCSYCVVPYVRGGERSREPGSIINEIKVLFDSGYREVTLLGQNVDSFRWNSESDSIDFPRLLDMAAAVNSQMRIRFSTSHPKDMSDEVLKTIARHDNICRHIHLPAQSGS